ncbi:MFS transporter [Lysinibacter cavernae]|uniref:Putative MFS family arabinose efflux permease n=1 Tax=Lysinibacter cavernae TaxID=1640652 RepID=A0A7X5R1G1_9MICO|nr:MFS transporter [Lysinibacter cavernae]NIH53831.1 putative MFS family arabinose efflux permease [Lysinibacter cavernae]
MSPTAVSAAPTAEKFPAAALVILAATTFLSVTIEMIPTGLMPEMSRELGVTEGQIGLLLTVFAFTVVVSAVPLTALTASWPRRTILVVALSGLATSTVLSAIAPTYELLIGARLIGGLFHGLFWSVACAYAGYIVSREQVGRAVSIIVSGGTLAFVLGVPLGTALGHVLGWRMAFGVIAIAGFIGVVLVVLIVPPVNRVAPAKRVRKRDRNPADALRASTWRDETTVITLFVCLLAAFIMVGHYSFYSYITPFLLEVVGVSVDALPTMLFIYGVAGAVGLVLMGWLFSSKVVLGLRWSLLGCLAGVVLLAAATAIPWLAFLGFVLWGVSFGILPPTLQTTMLRTASDRIRDSASAVYTSSFNFGIGAGALVGAMLLPGIGLAGLPWFYVVILVAAIVGSTVGIRAITRRRLRDEISRASSHTN